MQKYKTIFEKIWDNHIVSSVSNDTDILYIDKHFIHEVTSPQAFDGLRVKNLKVFRTQNTIATADHNVPTIDQDQPIKEKLSKIQVEKLTKNCEEFGVELFGLGHKNQGIVHVIGPELGITQPGMTIVCGDSHTSTHGALGSIAFGIGTSEVEMVLATQTLVQQKPKFMRINVNGKLKRGVTSKDVILYIISKLSAKGGTGYFIEYAGDTFSNMSIENRMTVCNMSIEMGSRGGLIAPDEKTFEYIKGRLYAPKGNDWDKAIHRWEKLYSDKGAKFDKEYFFNAEDILPMVTYGTDPGMGINITETIPHASSLGSQNEKDNFYKSLNYMGLKEGQKMEFLPVNYVFIGSCTNSRMEDIKQVAEIIKGKKRNQNTHVYIVPGSTSIANQIKAEGLDKVFEDADFEIRQSGCSACLGMNEDKIPDGEYCVSTSNRNFEGRQGPGARTILASPITAALASIHGRLVNPLDNV